LIEERGRSYKRLKEFITRTYGKNIERLCNEIAKHISINISRRMAKLITIP
jgi:hypothetical protein